MNHCKSGPGYAQAEVIYRTVWELFAITEYVLLGQNLGSCTSVYRVPGAPVTKDHRR